MWPSYEWRHHVVLGQSQSFYAHSGVALLCDAITAVHLQPQRQFFLSAVFWLSTMPRDVIFTKLQRKWNGLSIRLSPLTCDQDRAAVRKCLKTSCSLCIQHRGSIWFGIAVSAWTRSSAIDIQALKWNHEASVLITKLCRSAYRVGWERAQQRGKKCRRGAEWGPNHYLLPLRQQWAMLKTTTWPCGTLPGQCLLFSCSRPLCARRSRCSPP